MHRILIAPDSLHGSTIIISNPTTLHHLRTVLRLKAGDRLECFDGQGNRYSGTIEHSTADQIMVTVNQRLKEPHTIGEVWVAQALIKPERFEWMLQKAAELGVTRVMPMITARTTVRRADHASEHRMIRWRRILEEASRQSGRATVPILESPQSFAQVLQTCQAHQAILLTLTKSGPPLSQLLRDMVHEAVIVLLVGPEGDFSSEEVALATNQGIRTAQLGSLTLRAETAAIVALTLTQHALGVL